MKIKTTLLTAALFLALPLAACSKAPAATDASTAKSMPAAAQTMAFKANAVMIYADWCSSCKVLEPKVKKARRTFDGEGLNFITLDYTAKDKADLLAQAEAAGVGPAITKAMAKRVKTGQLILISADGERVLSKVGMNHTPDEIAGKFTRAIAKG